MFQSPWVFNASCHFCLCLLLKKAKIPHHQFSFDRWIVQILKHKEGFCKRRFCFTPDNGVIAPLRAGLRLHLKRAPTHLTLTPRAPFTRPSPLPSQDQEGFNMFSAKIKKHLLYFFHMFSLLVVISSKKS